MALPNDNDYYFRDGLKPPITCCQESLNSKQAVVNEARQIRSAQWRLHLADFMANAKARPWSLSMYKHPQMYSM